MAILLSVLFTLQSKVDGTLVSPKGSELAVIEKRQNKPNLESTQTSSPQKVESGLTGLAGQKQSQSRDETEIQRREERPAAFGKKHKESHKTKRSQKETALMQKSVETSNFR